MSPLQALATALIIIASATPVIVIGVVYYLKKRLEHKQILAAIEKGTSLSDLRPPKPNGALWIKNLTIGIALLVIGIGWGFVAPRDAMFALLALALIGVGIAWIIRGALNLKYQVKQPSVEDIAGENQEQAGE